MIRIGYVIAGSASASILIALFNKALTNGARNGAARVAWALAAIGLGTYVAGAVGGVSHVIEHGVVVYGSRSGDVTFHRSEHPIMFWGALGLLAILIRAYETSTCFPTAATIIAGSKPKPRTSSTQLSYL